MNYKHHYDVLVLRSKKRKHRGYTEKHHIIPKCLGGTNDIENIVRLTAEEHYVAHQLLAKIYPSNRKLLYAMTAMSNLNSSGKRHNNKLYGWIRKKVSSDRKGRSFSDEHRYNLKIALNKRVLSDDALQNMRNTSKKRIGISLSEEHKLKLSNAKKGKVFSEEHLKNLSNSHKGNKPNKATKLKMSLSHKGKVFSEEHRLNLSLAAKRRYAKGV